MHTDVGLFLSSFGGLLLKGGFHVYFCPTGRVPAGPLFFSSASRWPWNLDSWPGSGEGSIQNGRRKNSAAEKQTAKGTSDSREFP